MSGIPDDRQVQVQAVRPNGSLVYTLPGNANLLTYLPDDALEKRVLVLDTQPRGQIGFGESLQLLVNEIANPDTHQISLKQVLEIQASQDIPFFNAPDKILASSREQISQKLQGIPNLTVPRVLRLQPQSRQEICAQIQAAELKYPVILRACGSHCGQGVYLLPDPESILTLYAVAMDGREFYLSEFHDLAQNGIYASYRLVCVGEKIILRQVYFLDHWLSLESKCVTFMTEHPEWLAREAEIFARFDSDYLPWLQPMVNEIQARMGLDYFGIDCHLDLPTQTMLLFAAHANMQILKNVWPQPNRYDAKIATIQEALLELLLAKASPVDTAT